MPGMQVNNVPLYITVGLWIFNACVGPHGWFAMWNGIKEIFACIAVLCAAVAAWIWKNTAALGVSFGEYLYAQLDVAALLHILTETGTRRQATGIIVFGLFVSYAVLALGYSVWTFCVYPNTVSQQVLSVHGGHVFLPLVLAWIVLCVITFDAEDQGDQKSDGNDKHDNTGDQPPSAISEDQPNQTYGNNNENAQQSGVFSDVGVANGAGNALGRTAVGGQPGNPTNGGVSTPALDTANVADTANGRVSTLAHDIAQVPGTANGGVSALEVTTAEVLGTPSPSAHDNRKCGHHNKIIDFEGTMRGQPFARVSADDDSAETNVMDTYTD